MTFLNPTFLVYAQFFSTNYQAKIYRWYYQSENYGIENYQGKIIDNITSQTISDKLGNVLPDPKTTREKTVNVTSGM